MLLPFVMPVEKSTGGYATQTPFTYRHTKAVHSTHTLSERAQPFKRSDKSRVSPQNRHTAAFVIDARFPVEYGVCGVTVKLWRVARLYSIYGYGQKCLKGSSFNRHPLAQK